MASYIEGAIRSILVDTAAVSDICKARVYWLKTPDVPSMPYVMYFSFSDLHEAKYMTLDGSGAQTGQRAYQFSCISDDSLEALSLQKAVMNTLRWAEGTTYGFTIEIVGIENMRQRIDPTTALYVCDVDAIVEYFEA